MSDMNDFLELELLDHVLKGDSYTAPADPYASLFTATPDDAGNGTEVPVANAYVRKVIPFTNGAAAGAIINSADCTFDQATGSWGTITHMAIHDASAAGNFLFWSILTGGSKIVADGDTFKFATGDLTVALD